MVKSCGNDPQEDGQTQRRSPKGDAMRIAKQELGGIPSVLKSTFFVHPNGDCESALVISRFKSSHFVRRIGSPSLHQKPPNATYTPDEDVPREEPYKGAKAQFTEDEKDNASEEGGEGKRDKRGSNNSLGVVLTNNFGDVARKNVEERLE